MALTAPELPEEMAESWVSLFPVKVLAVALIYLLPHRLLPRLIYRLLSYSLRPAYYRHLFHRLCRWHHRSACPGRTARFLFAGLQFLEYFFRHWPDSHLLIYLEESPVFLT